MPYQLSPLAEFRSAAIIPTQKSPTSDLTTWFEYPAPAVYFSGTFAGI